MWPLCVPAQSFRAFMSAIMTFDPFSARIYGRLSETILGAVKDKAEPGDIPVPENIGVSNKPHEVYTALHRVGKLRMSVAFSENLGVKQALKFPRISIRHNKDARRQLASLDITRIKRIWWRSEIWRYPCPVSAGSLNVLDPRLALR
jgi:hypothetical protein